MGPATQEMEVVAMQRLLDGGWVYDLNERRRLGEAIEARKAMVVAGLNDPVALMWTAKLQTEVEPLLRMRLCPRSGYVIDRWIDQLQCWHQIPGTCGFEAPKPGLCERMRNQYDMWKRATPHDNEEAIANRARHPILQQRDAESQKVRDANEARATDMVLGAVDLLTNKRIKNFIEVERAVHTGETIVAHGETERSLDRMRQASFRAQQEPDPDDSERPDHPRNQRRGAL